MDANKALASIIFPSVRDTVADLEKRYPPRNLPDGAMVTRFAPSPTGFLHTGSLFASLISKRLAAQSNGIFFVRLEDTDTKREIQGTGDQVLRELSTFGVEPDEDFVKGGPYAPYVQSERKPLYDAVIKDLVERGKAYPCFCTHEDLDAMRKKQEELKVNPGYWGEYATCRNIAPEAAIERIKAGEPYVMRFRSPGSHDGKVVVADLIRGTLELTENDQDLVIMKSDGLPTYHFAHLVDDHFMRTTHVTRGEEWLPSLPIHVQLFEAMGWPRLRYAHLPVIMKLEDGKRRKLSKRKDPEAAVSYFLEAGYPIDGFLEYLMTIANTNFEEWRIKNPTADKFEFKLSYEKMTLDGALFDLEKVNSISKEILGSMTAAEITEEALKWATKYRPEIASAISSDEDYFKAIMAIERGGEKPRKDYVRYSDIWPIVDFMYEPAFNRSLSAPLPWNETIAKETIRKVLATYRNDPFLSLPEEEWFARLKSVAAGCGFAPSAKEYKKDREAYLGHIGDFAEIIRIAVSGRKNTPNFYRILTILGEAKVRERIARTIALL
ncbi:MAG: glutamate--tRNA ligase family protein [Candidatus Izemoplasmatales bacterium]